MRGWCSLCVAIPLLTLGPAASADEPRRPLKWEWGGGIGGGAFVGIGSDANRFAWSALLFGGYRPFELLSLQGLLYVQEISLTLEATSAKARHSGDFVAIALCPQFHAIGKRTGLELSAGPIAGYALMYGILEGSASELLFASRASVLGGNVAALWTPRGTFAAGVMGSYLQLDVHKACIQVDSATTYCKAFGDSQPRIASVQLILRSRF